MCKLVCSNFLDKCHAECCGIIPLEKDFYNANIEKIVNKPHDIQEYHDIDPFDNIEKDFIIPVTENTKCCFLKDDYTCAIYEIRPQVCKIYGDESVPQLSCHWQDKNGNKRSRQAKRLLERKTKKNIERFLKQRKEI